MVKALGAEPILVNQWQPINRCLLIKNASVLTRIYHGENRYPWQVPTLIFCSEPVRNIPRNGGKSWDGFWLIWLVVAVAVSQCLPQSPAPETLVGWSWESATHNIPWFWSSFFWCHRAQQSAHKPRKLPWEVRGRGAPCTAHKGLSPIDPDSMKDQDWGSKPPGDQRVWGSLFLSAS